MTTPSVLKAVRVVGGAGGGGAVDSVDGRTGVVTLGDKYVDGTGDTMTGDLTVPRLNLGDADTGLVRSAAGVVSGFTALALGLTPSTTGAIRLTGTQSISTRNGANTADIVLIRNSSTGVIVGGDGAVGVFLGGSAMPVVAPGTIGIGANPASLGSLRLSPTGSIWWRNVAGTGDGAFITSDATDTLALYGAAGISLGGAVKVSTSLAIGTDAATTGAIRLPNNSGIYIRTTMANDLQLIGMDASNNVAIRGYTTSGILLKNQNTDVASIQSQGLQLFDGKNLICQTGTGNKIGTNASQKIGFYGAAPVVQPTGVPAAATDADTTMALVNDLRAKLITTGLIAAA